MMLSELFHDDGGITQERILVMFFFCSNLAIRAVRSGLQSAVSSLTRWTVGFLRGTVTAWVRCKDTVLSGRVGILRDIHGDVCRSHHCLCLLCQLKLSMQV